MALHGFVSNLVIKLRVQVVHFTTCSVIKKYRIVGNLFTKISFKPIKTHFHQFLNLRLPPGYRNRIGEIQTGAHESWAVSQPVFIRLS